MPLYEYRCEKCGAQFEVRQKFSDEPLTTHEECGGAVHRLISAPAFQFKGSGWYVTDYAKSGKPGSGGANGDSPSKTGGDKSDAKKDATPAAAAKDSSKSNSPSSSPSSSSTSDSK